MRSLVLASFFAAMLFGLGLASPGAAMADQLVKFPAASAGKSGSPAGFGIQGYLSKPKGDGPFPAVVVLHSCLGMRADRRTIESRLAGWGYVSLVVDDFATRGLNETCTVDFPEGLSDAFGGLAYVAGLSYVDKTRIAALGYSQGAATALQVASLGAKSGFAIPDGVKFKAAATYYPGCAGLPGAKLQVPTLILVGAADTVTPAVDCERLAQGQRSGEVKLVVYPGAGHVFDDPAFAGGKSLMNMWLEFDPKAAAQSQSALHDFLAAKLGR